MTREEMWKEFENQLIRETRTSITMSHDVSERMAKSAIEETVAKWKERLEQQPCEDCISREKAKQFLHERLDRLNDDELYDIFSTIIDDMYNELPSVKPATQWHKIKTRPLTEEEKDEMYLNDNYYVFMYDCIMPDDEQEVLIKTKWGIEKTTYYTDDGCYFEGYEDEDDVIAWMPLPE